MNQLSNQTNTRRNFLTSLLGLSAFTTLGEIKVFLSPAVLGGTNVARVTVIFPPGTFCTLEKLTDPTVSPGTNGVRSAWSPVMPRDYLARRALVGNTRQYDFPVNTTNQVLFVRASDALSLSLPVDLSIYDGMNQITESSSLVFVAKRFGDMGFFVESIGGVKNENGFFWTLYVNGQYSDIGASTHFVKSDDRVFWRYEKR